MKRSGDVELWACDVVVGERMIELERLGDEGARPAP